MSSVWDVALEVSLSLFFFHGGSVEESFGFRVYGLGFIEVPGFEVLGSWDVVLLVERLRSCGFAHIICTVLPKSRNPNPSSASPL